MGTSNAGEPRSLSEEDDVMDRPLFRKRRTLFMYYRENVFLNWVLIGLLIISGAAFAQGIMGESKQAVPDFTQLDIDADGFITVAEARQMPGLAEKFGRMDVNGDHQLNVAEYTGYQALLKRKGSIDS
jgi:hypothetical protein